MATPFVLIGLPKSGSTWLQSLLEAHPRIRCLKEHKLTDLAGRMKQAVIDYMTERRASVAKLGQGLEDDRFPRDLHHDLVATAAARILEDLQKAAPQAEAVGFKDNLIGPAFVLDRTPAKLVLLTRDPRDIAVSAWRSSLGKSGSVRRHFGTLKAYAEDYAGYWITHMNARLEVLEAAPERCRMLSYEALHRDTAGELAALCAFLGVGVQASEIDRAVDAASFGTVAGSQPGSEDITRHARKGIVGDWRNHLSEESAQKLRRQCLEGRFRKFFPID